jgi:uncharacterized membrane protein YfcA
LIESLLLLIGLIVGTLIGISGIGGAAITAPILILMGIPPIHAVGSDMIFNAVTKSFGSVLHLQRHNISFTIIKWLMVGTLPAFTFGTILILMIKASLGWVVLNLFVLIFVSLILIAISGIYLVNIIHNRSQIQHENKGRFKHSLSIFIGFSVGFLFQITSIGAGTLLTPYLMKIMSSPRKIVGTSVFYGLVASTIGGLFHFGLDTVRFDILAPMLIGSIPGIFIGIRLNDKIPMKQLRFALSLMILASGILTLMKVITQI